MKKIFTIITIVIVSTIFCLNTSANTVFPETNGVYLCEEEQERIMLIIMNDDKFSEYLKYYHMTIDKTSIMPTYKAAVVDYSQTDVLNISRNSNNYVSDCLDENGNFTGVLIFRADDKSAKYISFASALHYIDLDHPELGMEENVQSRSYRIHEDFIKKNVGEDVTEKDVIFVGTDLPFTQGFYIKGNENREDVFVQISNRPGPSVVIPVKTELKELGQKRYEELQNFLAEKEQWEKEHPGETYIAVGGSGSDSYRSEKGLSPLAVMLISAAGVVLLAAAIVTVVVIRKKKQHQAA